MQAGFDAGNGRIFYTLPGARTDSILQLSQSSNVGVRGRWMFRVDGPNVLFPNHPTSAVFGSQVAEKAPGAD